MQHGIEVRTGYTEVSGVFHYSVVNVKFSLHVAMARPAIYAACSLLRP